ncbi:MAG: DinB family protein [Acidobacteriia bacterium]|nr:DinB family protein [Terriglobia bacterium]
MKEFRKYAPRCANGLGILALLGGCLVAPAMAQQPEAKTAAPPPTVAGAVRNFYNGIKGNITRSGEKMPEEFFGLRPGPQEEVRTFGQQLAHVAKYNYLWCAEAKGEKNPNDGPDLEKSLTTKDQIQKALHASYDYCDGAYNTLTDANGSDVITITQENGRVVQQTRMGLLMLNIVHNEEVYGSLVTTLRMKSIVPPSSERRPQPAGQEPRLQ